MTQKDFSDYMKLSEEVVVRLKSVSSLLNRLDGKRFPKSEWVTNWKFNNIDETVSVMSESEDKWMNEFVWSRMTFPYRYLWMSNDDIVDEIK